MVPNLDAPNFSTACEVSQSLKSVNQKVWAKISATENNFQCKKFELIATQKTSFLFFKGWDDFHVLMYQNAVFPPNRRTSPWKSILLSVLFSSSADLKTADILGMWSLKTAILTEPKDLLCSHEIQEL